MRERPKGPAVMYQKWRSLAFLHFSLDPAVVQALLPRQLEVDTYPDADGVERAWVGLAPFRMKGVRPRGLPPAPGLSAFPETNVRTYVHRAGREPGVWFFSLDAANAVACWAARRFFALPYYHARMRCVEHGDTVDYRSERLWRERGDAPSEIRCSVGEPLPPAEPGTLEFFLIERYVLYAVREGQTFTGRVHHPPYPLRTAQVEESQTSLLAAAGLPLKPWEHTCFSPGVDVEIFPPSINRDGEEMGR